MRDFDHTQGVPPGPSDSRMLIVGGGPLESWPDLRLVAESCQHPASPHLPDHVVRVAFQSVKQGGHCPPVASTGHHHMVESVAVSADGRRAVSGGQDGTVRVWDLAQGAELASFISDNPITVIAATPPGTRVIAGAATGSVHLLELRGHE